MAIELRRGALNDACIDLAKSVFPGSMELSTDLIETLAHRYQKAALRHADYIIGRERDPNIITRAVTYLASAHAIPPMGTEVAWFTYMLDCVIEIAVPNSRYGGDAALFLKDVGEGVAESIEAANEPD